MLRDQNWKIVNFEVIPPYAYQISKLKSEYSFEFYEDNNILFKQPCRYPFFQLCVAEYPQQSGKVKAIYFYQSIDPITSFPNEYSEFRLKSIDYLDEKNHLIQIPIQNQAPNSKASMSSQEAKLGFNIVISLLGFLLLAYLCSIANFLPKPLKFLIYTILVCSAIGILSVSIMMLIK